MTRSSEVLAVVVLLSCLRLPAAAQNELVDAVNKSEKTGTLNSGKSEKVEEAEPGCFSTKIKAITDRPTISSGTETTQCGVLELLSGPERIWSGHGVHQDDVAEQLQFGLTPRLDLHYARNGFFGIGSNPGPFTGQGDTFVGARYRLSKEHHALPSFGTFYTLKVPTAGVANGTGTGRFDHSLTFVAGKDLPKVHVDFNVTPTFAGRPDRGGYDKNTQMTLFGFVPVTHGLTVVAGSFGSTALNDTTPAYASATLGMTWQPISRLIFDLGWDEGLTTAAPRKRIGFGLSCAPTNLYALVAGKREPVR